jgi:drug/metabolite transporter (DMT)-like permease
MVALASSTRARSIALMPALFVVLWSTGFIGGKFGLPYAGPMTFLTLRFWIVAAVMLPVAFAAGSAWPRGPRELGHVVAVGLLIQFTYLGGCFFAMSRGVSAGIAALIVGLQPVLTAALAGFVLGERLRPPQWLGLALGLVGVAMVCWEKLDVTGGHAAGLAAAGCAVLGITFGTLYQKRFCAGQDLVTSTVIQNAAAAVAMTLAALLFEEIAVAWTGRFVFALVWLVLVLSVGATILLLFLIRRGAAAQIASLFYLVPAVTALMAFFLFGETLHGLALVGMAVAIAGVALVNRG